MLSAEPELGPKVCNLSHANGDPGTGFGETFCGDSHIVLTGLQAIDAKATIGGGFRGARGVRADILDGDFRLLDDCPKRIRYAS
jgi:hypothetical protein